MPSLVELIARVPLMVRFHGNLLPLSETPLSPVECRDLIYSCLTPAAALANARDEANISSYLP